MPESALARSGYVHPTVHVNRDGICGRCELPLEVCRADTRCADHYEHILELRRAANKDGDV